MNPNSSVIYVFLILVMMSACSKKDDGSLNGRTTVTGRLLDASTLEPIAGGVVSLHHDIYTDDTLTDLNGEYSFDFKHDSKYIYSLTAEAGQYLGNDNIGSWGDYYPSVGRPSPVQYLDLNHANHIDIKLPPEGFIKYHLKQVSSYSGNIQARILPYNSNHVITYNGQGLDTEYIDRLPGSAFGIAGCSIIRDGDSLQSFYDTIFVSRFDTINYTIEF